MNTDQFIPGTSITIPESPDEIRGLAQRLNETAELLNTMEEKSLGRRIIDIEYPDATVPKVGTEFNVAVYSDTLSDWTKVFAIETHIHTVANTLSPGDTWNWEDATFEYVGRFAFARRIHIDDRDYDRLIEVENPHYAVTATLSGIEHSARAARLDVAESIAALCRGAQVAVQDA